MPAPMQHPAHTTEVGGTRSYDTANRAAPGLAGSANTSLAEGAQAATERNDAANRTHPSGEVDAASAVSGGVSQATSTRQRLGLDRRSTATPPKLLRIRADPADSWPPQELLDASLEVLEGMGTTATQMQSHISRLRLNKAAGAEILQRLYELCCSPGNEGDLRVYAELDEPTDAGSVVGSTLGSAGAEATQGGVAATAHKKILSAVSSMLACKFAGAWQDSNVDEVRLPCFGMRVAQAAIKFAYLGACEIPIGDLHALYALARYWDFGALGRATVRQVAELPPAMCLRELVGWEPSSPDLEGFGHLLANRASVGFQYFAGTLGRGQPSGQAWMFIRQVDAMLVGIPREKIARLQAWIKPAEDDQQEEEDEDGKLGESVAQLFVAALGFADDYDREEVTQLCTSPLRCVLSRELSLKVIKNLCVKFGITRLETTGQRIVLPWVRWAYTGMSQSFSVLRAAYGVLFTHQQELAAQARREREENPIDPENMQEPEVELEPEVLDPQIDSSFAAAFVDTLSHDRNAVGEWEQLLFNGFIDDPTAGGNVVENRAANTMGMHVVVESATLMSRFLRHNPKLLCGLSAKAALFILCPAIKHSQHSVTAVHVSGPKTLEGTYERVNGVFTRDRGPLEVPLVLVRVARSSAIALRVYWRGIPQEWLERATAEWKIMPAERDIGADTPLALALDTAPHPWGIKNSWYLKAERGSRFLMAGEDGRPTLKIEATKMDEADDFVEAIHNWAQEREDALDELEHLASSDLPSEASQGGFQTYCPSIVSQLCRAVRARRARLAGHLGSGSFDEDMEDADDDHADKELALRLATLNVSGTAPKLKVFQSFLTDPAFAAALALAFQRAAPKVAQAWGAPASGGIECLSSLDMAASLVKQLPNALASLDEARAVPKRPVDGDHTTDAKRSSLAIKDCADPGSLPHVTRPVARPFQAQLPGTDAGPQRP